MLPRNLCKQADNENTALSKGKEMEDWRYGAENTVI